MTKHIKRILSRIKKAKSKPKSEINSLPLQHKPRYMEDVNRVKLVLVEKKRIELTDAAVTKSFLVERYKDTLSELARRVADYKHEVNDYLKEMGFVI